MGLKILSEFNPARPGGVNAVLMIAGVDWEVPIDAKDGYLDMAAKSTGGSWNAGKVGRPAAADLRAVKLSIIGSLKPSECRHGDEFEHA